MLFDPRRENFFPPFSSPAMRSRWLGLCLLSFASAAVAISACGSNDAKKSFRHVEGGEGGESHSGPAQGGTSGHAGVGAENGGAGTENGGAGTENGGAGVAEEAGSAGMGGGSVTRGCPPPNGMILVHQSTTTTVDETWVGDGTIHSIPSDITIYTTVTLQPCAEVQIAPRATVTVRGAIVADGTADQPIHIGAAVDGSPWAKIATSSGTGTLRFVYTTIDGGGDPLNSGADYGGMLVVTGGQPSPAREILHADHLTVSGSASQGIVLSDGGGFSGTSTALTITGSQGYPVNTWTRLAGSLPDGDYTGNLRDEILLLGGGPTDAVVENMTLHNRGVPYHVGATASSGEIRIGTVGAAPAALIIEPGVELRFIRAGRFAVMSLDGTALGALIAVGTAGMPIIFTSAVDAPAPGDWEGMWFDGTQDSQTRLDYVEVNYAGGPSGALLHCCPLPGATGASDDAAIIIDTVPQTQFVTNTRILASAGYGINRGWSGGPLDFLATNEIEAASCRQSFPRPSMSACPDPVPCP
jgi:hypothetical protein